MKKHHKLVSLSDSYNAFIITCNSLGTAVGVSVGLVVVLVAAVGVIILAIIVYTK